MYETSKTKRGFKSDLSFTKYTFFAHGTLYSSQHVLQNEVAWFFSFVFFKSPDWLKAWCKDGWQHGRPPTKILDKTQAAAEEGVSILSHKRQLTKKFKWHNLSHYFNVAEYQSRSTEEIAIKLTLWYARGFLSPKLKIQRGLYATTISFHLNSQISRFDRTSLLVFSVCRSLLFINIAALSSHLSRRVLAVAWNAIFWSDGTS